MSEDENAAERSGRRSPVLRSTVFGLLLLAASGGSVIASDGTPRGQLRLVAEDDYAEDDYAEDDYADEVDPEDQRLRDEPMEARPWGAEPWEGQPIDEMDSGDRAAAGEGDETDETLGADETPGADEAEASERRAARPPPADVPQAACKPTGTHCTVGGWPPCCSGVCLDGRCAF